MAVRRCFPELLFEMAISTHRAEIFSIKLEVDTRPPSGAILETTVLNRFTLLHLQHHDRASLFAGKLHALLERPFTKGRDLYDLVWYLSDPTQPDPNLEMLNNALVQTHWQGEELTNANWRKVVWQRVQGMDWENVAADVRPFLERASDAEFITRDNVKQLLA